MYGGKEQNREEEIEWSHHLLTSNSTLCSACKIINFSSYSAFLEVWVWSDMLLDLMKKVKVTIITMEVGYRKKRREIEDTEQQHVATTN